jgi:TM2 domain-containing membrane protein YozV
MKFIYSIALFTILISSCYAQMNYKDVVYLKDGSVIKGIIIEQIPNVSLKIETSDGSIFVYKMEKIEKITKESDQKQSVKEDTSSYSGVNSLAKRKKSPILACILSVICPGVGQYYNGQVVKGVVQELLWVGGLTLALTAGISTTSSDIYYNYYGYSYYEGTTSSTSITTWYWVGLGVTIASEIWSIIDAPISASQINKEASKENAHSYGHLFEYNLNKNTVVGLDPAIFRNGNGASLTVHF